MAWKRTLALLLAALFGAPSFGQPPAGFARSRISGEILAHEREKRLPPGANPDEHSRNLRNRGLNPQDLDREDVALYVAQPLTRQEIAALRVQGIDIRDTYVPPVAGKHPNGFYLATVRYASLTSIQSDPRIVRLETTEMLSTPKNDLGAVMTHVDAVHSGSGVAPRNGNGVKIAIADSGFDRTHPDLPAAPVETFDMTTGFNPATWNTNVANHATYHGTHVEGTAVGSGFLSAGKYAGMAPGALVHLYKIGNNTTASATETDEIEAVNRAAAVGCKIFSMSYGGYDAYMDGSSAMCQAIDAATAGGMTCFISAGNEADAGQHASVEVAPASTSPAIAYTTTAGVLAAGANVDIRVIWRDGAAGDANLSMACTSLGSGESLTQSFSGFSSRATDAKRYTLHTNQASGASKSYSFVLQNTAPSGATPKIHLYDITGGGTFNAPDSAFTIGNPAVADTAIAVGAWTQRRTWTNFQGSGFFNAALTVGTLAPFSSLGPRIDGTLKPDVVAPGAGTISTRDSTPGLAPTVSRIIDNDGLNLNGSGPANYFLAIGTSMACPHAAGLAALVLEAQPTLTPAQLRLALIRSASQTNSPDNSVGYGLLNALGAVTADFVPPSASMSSAASDPASVSPIPVTVAFSEPVAGFTADDISAANATVAGFGGSGADYSFQLVPTDPGLVTADIAAGAAQDASGNPSTAAPQFSRTFDPPCQFDLSVGESFEHADATLACNVVRLCNTGPVKTLVFDLMASPASALSDAAIQVQAAGRAAGWTAAHSPLPDGSIRIQLSNPGAGLIAPGCDAVVRIDFSVAPATAYGSDIPLILKNIAATDSASQPLFGCAAPGLHHRWLPGDVTRNQSFDLFDLLRGIDVFLGVSPTPTAYELNATDVDRNQTVDLFDLLCLIDAFLNVPGNCILSQNPCTSL